ncbi:MULTISPECIES: LysR family transcriptional regulator [Marinobacter]|uniref:LysR family transcriptional regulator n=1 Tax=Marinobacter suaedae TaxID=3057675 RepID=A0ABT8VZ81_9GAMM|nr:MULTISPECIES: LysR family transcriptional regulator [unclassified Marinobacter]MBZ2169424.1 LysR family transcriptional regulator [Marinobacter sp. F4216]MDO3721289.1 LysR family transcriptional regulator [Marinobacter sp. chi1]
MNPVDTLNLDLRALGTFIAVLDEGSVSKAAIKLGVSQSAVSHTLDRLRQALGDPLFVKSGRGITPTRYAQQVGPHIRQILDDLQSLASGPFFTPQSAEFTFTIAANDYQRDLLLPPLVETLRREAPGIRLQVIPSGIPSADMLRKDLCDLIISPHAPEATDIMQRGLMADRMVVFYDQNVREAPKDLAEYLQADHIALLFASGEKPALEGAMSARGLSRRNVVTVSNFSGLPEFLRGSDLLATAPERMSNHLLRDFAWTPLPFEFKPFTLLMLWHRRNQNDPAHRWLRNQVNSVAATMNGLNQ